MVIWCIHHYTKTMLSTTIGTAKNFTRLSACIQNKSNISKYKKVLRILPCSVLQRTVFTSVRNNRRVQSKHDIYDFANYDADPKYMGKIVSLDLNENEVKNDYKDVRISKRKKKRKSLTAKSVEVEENNAKIVQDSDSNSCLDQNFEESETPKLNTNNKTVRQMRAINFPKGKDSTILISVMTNLKSKKQREKQKKIIIEGQRMIHEALTAGYELELLFFSRYSMVEKLNVPHTTKLYRIPYKQLQLWSDVVTSQGIIGVCKMPDLNIKEENPDSLPITVICDNIREPGNLGAVLRVVAAVGCKKLILTKGCVDIWESKVLRTACGAHFRLPILKNVLWDEIENEITEDSKIILADTKYSSYQSSEKTDMVKEEKESSVFKSTCVIRENLPLLCYDSLDFRNQNTVIVMGGETEGISGEAYKFAEKKQGVRVHIPMSNNIESLNTGVALGILSYEVKRQIEGSKTKSQVESSDC